MLKRDILRRLIRESHQRQFNGEDYQAVAWDIYQGNELTEEEMTEIESSPQPDCECGFCATAAWQD